MVISAQALMIFRHLMIFWHLIEEEF